MGDLTAQLASSSIEHAVHPRLATLGVSEVSYFHVCWAVQVEWSGALEGLGDGVRPMQPYFEAIGRAPSGACRRADR